MSARPSVVRPSEVGILFVVATPLGNLKDITLRALEVLKSADLIASEDTRTTRKLLSTYGIKTKLISLHEHNEKRRTPEIISRLKSGWRVALVSEAGTPGISDPGAYLVRQARAAGIQVIPVPGPSAPIAALSVSGIRAEAFVFLGFLPQSLSKKTEIFSTLRYQQLPVVFFESPRRIKESLQVAVRILGDREAFLAREMTKVHEEYYLGSLKQLTEMISEREARGEFVVVISGAKAEVGQIDLSDLICQLLEDGLPAGEVARVLARDLGLSRKELYKKIISIKRGDDG